MVEQIDMHLDKVFVCLYFSQREVGEGEAKAVRSDTAGLGHSGGHGEREEDFPAADVWGVCVCQRAKAHWARFIKQAGKS